MGWAESRQRWEPEYTVRFKDGEKFINIEDVGTEECPMSVIHRHPEMIAIANEVIAISAIREATGATPYGPSSTKWPARWFDAVRIGETENRKIERAKDRLLNSLG